MIQPAVFREQLNTVFHVDQGSESIPLLLAEVADERIGGGMQQFSLLFHGSADQVLPQGTYSLQHESLGPLALFIVPIIGSNAERIIYQACFSAPVTP